MDFRMFIYALKGRYIKLIFERLHNYTTDGERSLWNLKALVKTWFQTSRLSYY